MRDLLDLLLDLRTASRAHQRVRALVLVGALLFLAGLALAGGANGGNATLVLVLAVMVVVQPHALAPGLFLAVAVAMWWAAVDTTWHWALLPAALGLVLLHTSAALCASVPPQAVIPAEVLRTWGARLALVAALTVGVWGVAGLVTLGTGAGAGTLPGIAGLLLLAVGLVAYLRWRGRSALGAGGR